MPPRIVVIGASAGGIETLRELVRDLPASFSAPICVVMHISPESPGVLAEILRRAGRLFAATAQSGERLRAGRIYVAPPDHHLLVEPGIARVTKGPRENRFRPAIDPLFRSAAQGYGPAAIGVILSGNLDDGTAGLWVIKKLGGVTIVQDPADALFPSMPNHAIRKVDVDYVVPLAKIAPLLHELTARPVRDAGEITVPEHGDVEIRIAKEQNSREAGLERVGEPSPYACPECHGVLLQLKEADRVRFRCHIGHAYSMDSLLADIDTGIENAMGVAVRALEEAGLLMQQMARQLTDSRQDAEATRMAEAAERARQQSESIRDMLNDRTSVAVEESDMPARPD
jgi:two-component system chemotaxis response regulator CheB